MEPAILAPSDLGIKCSATHFVVVFLLLTISGDIELNPGPVRFPCGTCSIINGIMQRAKI